MCGRAVLAAKCTTHQAGYAISSKQGGTLRFSELCTRSQVESRRDRRVESRRTFPMDSPLSPPSSPVTATGEAPGWITATSNVLLFFLVFGLASSVDVKLLRHRELQLVRGCAVALAMQFVVLPFLGFCSVRAFNLEETIGVMLQIVVSSPGGAYSNWWCSMFNADLALSVTATALSTVLSAGLLPLNLYIYLSATYGGAILATLRWDLLLISISVVTTAVLLGLTVASKYVEKAGHESMKSVRRRRVTILGNVSGACLIIFSIVCKFLDLLGETPSALG